MARRATGGGAGVRQGFDFFRPISPVQTHGRALRRSGSARPGLSARKDRTPTSDDPGLKPISNAKEICVVAFAHSSEGPVCAGAMLLSINELKSGMQELR